MKKYQSFLRNELRGWHFWEVLWLAVAVSVIIGLSVYWQDTPMGILSSSTGIACVICTGKGKLSAYLFGLVNSVLYSIISFRATYYGETMLNALYYVPMQFAGFWVWSKNMNSQTGEVKKLRMQNKHRVICICIMTVVTVAYGWLLKWLGDAMPYVDSFTTVASVIAMIASVKMYAEQWWIWVAVDVFSVILWLRDFLTGNDNIATLLMWCVYLINAVIMLVKWEKEAREGC